MKILIISFTFPPNKDGVANAAATMAEGFLERGWQVEILTEESSVKRESFDWNGARVTEFSYTGNPISGLRIHGTEETYAQYLSRNWDCIIFHAYLHPLLVAIPLLDAVRAKKILVSHGYGVLVWQPAREFPFGLGQILLGFRNSLRMARWLPQFDKAVYLSEKTDLLGFYDHLLATFTGYAGREVIPNGIDPNEHGTDPAGFRRIHGISDTSFMMLCVANYSPRKDQGYAARAFRRAAIADSVLVFIGSEFNEYSEDFQRADLKKHENGSPGRIIWLDGQNREFTLNALAACDAFVLSARHEAQPIALLEAMREGKPWVARRAGCIDLMEGGICTGSESEMAHAMRKIRDEPSLSKKLGSEGKQAVASRYTRSAYTSAYCKLVEDLVENTPDSQYC